MFTFALSAKKNSNSFSLTSGIFEQEISDFSNIEHPDPLIRENFYTVLIVLEEI